MTTISGLISEVTKELGYNPYESFRTKCGIVKFVDALNDDMGEDIYNAIVYQSARAIRQMPLNRFFDFVTPVAFNDLYIVALMIEIYRRTRSNPKIMRFYFSDSQYVEFTDWSDLLSAIEQLKPHYPELQAYKGIESGVAQAYLNMSDQHLLNAWFQRVLNEVTADDDKIYAFCDLNKLMLESPEVDGLISFATLVGLFE